jgi:hypothetical protein
MEVEVRWRGRQSREETKKLISADEVLDALSTISNHKIVSPGSRNYILARFNVPYFTESLPSWQFALLHIQGVVDLQWIIDVNLYTLHHYPT